MYKTDDIIFFGSTGVCRVVSVGEPSIAGLPSGVDYYTLQPLSQSHREMIYVPTNTKAFIRATITPRQARDYISAIKDIKPVFPQSRNPKAVQDFYSALISTYDCHDLLVVIVSLMNKKKECRRKNKSLNQTQTTFLKRRQEMVYNEFSYVLDKPFDLVAKMVEDEIVYQ